MRIFIKKTKESMVVYKESTLQSLLSDFVTAIVMILLIGLDILFSKIVGRSIVIDVLVCCLLIMYLFTFGAKKEEVSSIDEVKKELDKLV